MNRDERALARIIFELRIRSSDGQAFEDLFVALMQKANPRFTPVKPQGQLGDRKNDGYDPDKGCYYQVFAPEDISKTPSKAVSKLKTDFNGLKKYWDSIYKVKQYRFVMNDKYGGSFPTIEADLASIKKSHNLEECNTFLAKDLEDILFSLPDDVIVSIIGFIPDPSRIEMLDYSVLNKVIRCILNHRRQLDLTQLLTAPDFGEKIEFNGLGLQVATLLTAASYQVGILEEYFNKNSNFTKQEVRDTLNDMYKAAKAKYSGLPDSGDLIFFDILKSATPNNTEAAQSATLVVMGYFFESCDIFDDPK